MNLPVPVVGQESGPQWASDLNSCLSIIDSHTHLSGSGVPITTGAININSDLSINNNNITTIRSNRYTAQSGTLNGASDLGCVYVSGVDLYFNDGSGNKVRITQSGAVAGTPGSISNLVSPASANYNSGSSSFVWQSNSNTAANMDFGSAILRNLTSGSNGVTVSPPSSLPSNYTITLPSLPAQQNIMTLDSSGNMSAPWNVDNSTLQISSNQLKVASSGITTTQLADASVTQPKLYTRTTGSTASAGNIAVSSSCGKFSTTSALTFVPITNLSVTLSTTGRPVLLKILTSPNSTFNTNNPSMMRTQDPNFSYLGYYRDGSLIGYGAIGCGESNTFPSIFTNFEFLDTTASAGSHTYALYAASTGSGALFEIWNFIICAFEIN